MTSRVTTSPPSATGQEWWDALAEGVLFIHAGTVIDLNTVATRLLDVERERARGAALISVVRDHRIEEAWLSSKSIELDLRSRRVQLVPMESGLLLRDVTDQRRAEESARELLAVLSHELRTPVTSVRAALEALAADPGPELAARFLASSIAEAERLTRLLDDLTVDVKPPVARRILLLESAARAIEVLQPVLERRDIKVVSSLPDRVVLADEDKLLQVLVNLLENAAVHGPANDVVELTGWLSGNWLRLEVRDRGVPLDPGTVGRLFQPHSRGRGNAKGTGLGLYIVRSISARWGGEAWGGPRTDGIALGNAFGVSVPLAT